MYAEINYLNLILPGKRKRKKRRTASRSGLARVAAKCPNNYILPHSITQFLKQVLFYLLMSERNPSGCGSCQRKMVPSLEIVKSNSMALAPPTSRADLKKTKQFFNVLFEQCYVKIYSS